MSVRSKTAPASLNPSADQIAGFDSRTDHKDFDINDGWKKHRPQEYFDYRKAWDEVPRNKIELMALADAWIAPAFQEIRRRHLEKDLCGTFCGRCWNGDRTPVQPLVPQFKRWWFTGSVVKRQQENRGITRLIPRVNVP